MIARTPRAIEIAARKRAHYEIEGVGFSLKAAFSVAREKGFAGKIETLHWRLTHGARTWDELTAPLANVNESKRVATRAKKREEMQALCADLDARKAALGQTP